MSRQEEPDFYCMQYEADCKVGIYERKHKKDMEEHPIEMDPSIKDDAERTADYKRRVNKAYKEYIKTRNRLIRENCKGCGFEYSENQLRKDNPDPWVYDEETGLRHRHGKKRFYV